MVLTATSLSSEIMNRKAMIRKLFLFFLSLVVSALTFAGCLAVPGEDKAKDADGKASENYDLSETDVESFSDGIIGSEESENDETYCEESERKVNSESDDDIVLPVIPI